MRLFASALGAAALVGFLAINAGGPNVARGDDSLFGFGASTPTATPVREFETTKTPLPTRTPEKSDDSQRPPKEQSGKPCGPGGIFSTFVFPREGDDDRSDREPECRPLEVRGIEPEVGIAGITKNVEISGRGFISGMSAFLLDMRFEPPMPRPCRSESDGATVESDDDRPICPPIQPVPLTMGGIKPPLDPNLPLIQLQNLVINREGTRAKATIPPIPAGKYSLIVKLPNNDFAFDRKAYKAIPDGPFIESVRPRRGPNDRPTEIRVEGLNFQTGLSATLQMSNTVVPLDVLKVEPRRFQAIVPAGLSVGPYSMTVTNPDGKKTTLDRGFVVTPPDTFDLFIHDEDIWTDPRQIAIGDIATLGARIHWRGPRPPTATVEVGFYLGDPMTSTQIGLAVLPPPGAPSQGVDNIGVPWNTVGLSGTVWVSVVIDPNKNVPEFSKVNNFASRQVRIGVVESGDRTPPVISKLEINGGATDTVSPTINVSLVATDTNGAVRGMFVIERYFVSGAKEWVPVQTSGWVTYTSSFSWTLAPGAGTHVLQAWVSDNDGNISKPSRTWINMDPVSDSVRAGQIRFYRVDLQAGDQISVTLSTLSGDADLYLFGPDGKRIGYSILPTTTADFISAVAPVSGTYQIEVEGFLSSTYSISWEVTKGSGSASLASFGAATVPAGKQVRDLSASDGINDVSIDNTGVPNDVGAPNVGKTVFVPLAVKGGASGW